MVDATVLSFYTILIFDAGRPYSYLKRKGIKLVQLKIERIYREQTTSDKTEDPDRNDNIIKDLPD